MTQEQPVATETPAGGDASVKPTEHNNDATTEERKEAPAPTTSDTDQRDTKTPSADTNGKSTEGKDDNATVTPTDNGDQGEGKEGAKSEGKDGAKGEGKDGAKGEGKDGAKGEGKEGAKGEAADADTAATAGEKVEGSVDGDGKSADKDEAEGSGDGDGKSADKDEAEGSGDGDGKSADKDEAAENGDNVTGDDAKAVTKEDADAEDETWWGDGADAEAAKTVREGLGDKVADLYNKGTRQLNGASDTASRVLAASSTFVQALQLVSEDKQTSVAFALLALAHGLALVRYVEMEGTGSSAVAAKIVRALQSAAGSAAGDGGRVVEEEEEEDGDGGEDEDISAKEGDEEEDVQSAWAQLEVARLIFAREKWTQREGDCRAGLGELLMVSDEGKQAASEFETAARLFTDKRRKSECLYKKYLSLRNASQQDAVNALREAVEVFESSGGKTDVVADMKTELSDMEAAIKEAGAETQAKEQNGKQAEKVVEVVAVQPKRKRDVVAEQKEKEEGEEKNGKKARLE